ncbi:MAG: 16S rRNA (cytidine(1402)-2'-O)-methyltransferase [Parachlamydiaceae bacterium]|nr:16S rRNA (cytidine(1402)-2'-O)-methyltransferase [Parachlamydiaceae bacterium]
MLYLIATPIGNLSDITFRAIDTLKACHYILCEDTRHTRPLLTHYEIQKPLKSFHKFNESFKENTIIEDLIAGLQIALVSDAGTPGISDPGAQLVARCVAENIQVISIPGPCAAVAALSCSGLNTDLFQFYGFLPKKTSELTKVLNTLLNYPGTTICYESPHRLLDVLEVLQELAPTRKLVVARELTKKFEEIQRGTAESLLNHWKQNPLKGEIVLMLEGYTETQELDWSELTPGEHVMAIQETYKLSRMDAIKMVAKLRNVPKRSIYNETEKE